MINNNLKARKSTDGSFIRIDFSTQDGENIGYTNIRLKKGWNQIHIEIYEKYRKMGYAIKMLEYNIKQYDYIVFPENRITNKSAITAIIAKFSKNPTYEVFETKYDETVISNGKQTRQDILLTLA